MSKLILTIIEFEMPYYHLRIKQKNRRGPVYIYDQSKKMLEAFLATARKGLDVSYWDYWLEPESITDIEVAKTYKKSDNYGIGFMKGENIFSEAKNVTSQFIKKPIERAKSQEILPLKVRTPSRNVFIVHGKDKTSLKELKTMLREFKLNPIVLHEQPSGSRTIVEKLEKYSNVGYAFVILTPDDIAGSRHKYDRQLKKIDIRAIEDWRERARQNVILEFGYFMGLLGRDRVCCLYKGDVELPSDMHGIVYIPFKDSVNETRDKIAKELKAAGYEIRL